jgi:hypothetical protein
MGNDLPILMRQVNNIQRHTVAQEVLMGVCGLVHKRKVVPGVDGVAYSPHVLCSERCKNAPIKSIMFSVGDDMRKGKAFLVGKRLYRHMKQIMSYSQMAPISGTLLVYAWRPAKETYSLWATSEGLTDEEALRQEAYRWAKEGGVPILLTTK